jgi:formylglycine-generating enzyme required for sulfatase activity
MGQASALELEWVLVSDPGNPPDRTGYGAVSYAFQISKTEVTLAQYAEFLNAVAATDPHNLWSASFKNAPVASMKHDRILIARTGEPGSYSYSVPPEAARQPASFIGFFEAMRFANWIHNGQGKADTESGAYAIAANGGLAVHSPDARVWIPTEDEWYKAAYYHPESKGGPAGGYWHYPTKSNVAPAVKQAGDPEPNAASFGGYAGEKGHTSYDFLPVAGLPNAASFYGTFDQGGNVWEWNEAVLFQKQRGMRGGSTPHTIDKLRSTVRSSASPERRYPDTGFRLARALPAPESAPSASSAPAATPAAASAPASTPQPGNPQKP